MSAGVLHPASNSSIKSFDFFIRSPSISEDRLHKMIYTLNRHRLRSVVNLSASVGISTRTAAGCQTLLKLSTQEERWVQPNHGYLHLPGLAF
jgi:hypothetical protein